MTTPVCNLWLVLELEGDGPVVRHTTSRSFHTLQSSALDKLRRRKRGECKGDTSGKSDWCRETVFPELYFGGLVEALEEHMANGDLVFPEGK